MRSARLRILTQFNAIPQGVKFLVDMRAALLDDARGERLVFRRVEPIEPTGEDGERARLERRLMRGGVDAAREARRDDEALAPEVPRQDLRHLAAGDGGIAGADDRNHGLDHQPLARAADGDERGRRVDFAQPGRIVPLPDRDDARAETRQPRELALGLGGLRDADLSSRAAGEARQRLERCGCGTEMIDEVAERRRSDILAADQAQPGDALVVREPDRG